MATSVSEAGIKYCVVCGAGSHRKDWVNKVGNSVACDSHSRDEVARAVAASTTKAPSAPVAANVATQSAPIPPAVMTPVQPVKK